MSETPVPSLGDWRYGIHPHAAGLRIRSLGRVELPLGEALRLEMDDPVTDDAVVHLQHFIATDAGPWAVWISCPRGELAAHEAMLAEIVPTSAALPQDQPPTFHPRRAPFAGLDEG